MRRELSGGRMALRDASAGSSWVVGVIGRSEFIGRIGGVGHL
jgi:hypothetical protein